MSTKSKVSSPINQTTLATVLHTFSTARNCCRIRSHCKTNIHGFDCTITDILYRLRENLFHLARAFVVFKKTMCTQRSTFERNRHPAGAARLLRKCAVLWAGTCLAHKLARAEVGVAQQPPCQRGERRRASSSPKLVAPAAEVGHLVASEPAQARPVGHLSMKQSAMEVRGGGRVQSLHRPTQCVCKSEVAR